MVSLANLWGYEKSCQIWKTVTSAGSWCRSTPPSHNSRVMLNFLPRLYYFQLQADIPQWEAFLKLNNEKQNFFLILFLSVKLIIITIFCSFSDDLYSFQLTYARNAQDWKNTCKSRRCKHSFLPTDQRKFRANTSSLSTSRLL